MEELKHFFALEHFGRDAYKEDGLEQDHLAEGCSVESGKVESEAAEKAQRGGVQVVLLGLAVEDY